MSAVTKMLVVLQLVFSLVLSVLLVLMVSKQENYKSAAEQASAGRVAAAAMVTASEQKVAAADSNVREITSQLTSAQSKLNETQALATNGQSKADANALQLQQQVAAAGVQISNLTTSLQTANASLSAKDEELGKLRPQVAEQLNKYNELYRAKNEADNQLRAAELAIRKLQEEMAAAPAAAPGAAVPNATPGQVAQLSSNTSAAGPINAKITRVAEASGRVLIEMPLGTRDGMQTGTKLMIYRGNTYLTDAVIQRVTADQSVAAVQGAAASQVKEGDMVSTVGQ